MSTVIAQSKPVARKDHHCNLCGRIIGAGETYDRARLVAYDDGPYVFKTCTHCQALLFLHPDSWEYADEGYTTDDIIEWEPSTIAGLRAKAMFMRGWRRRDGALYPVPQRQTAAPITEATS